MWLCSFLFVLSSIKSFHVITAASVCNMEQRQGLVIYNCSGLVLKEIPPYVPDFSTHINISRNPLPTLPESFLMARYFNLMVLDVSRTYITQDTLAPNTFSKLLTLNELLMQNCRITSLNRTLIRGSAIKILRLDGNKLKYLPPDFLIDVPRLEELTVSGCELEFISGYAFRSAGSTLKRLDLSGNFLETLSVDLKPYIFTEALQSIKLYENFWVCDCHLRWLREEIGNTPAAWYFDGYELIPTCEDPSILKHKNWFSAKKESFGCIPELISNQPEVQAPTEANVTLTCAVVTSKPYSIEWTKDNYTIIYKTRYMLHETYNGSVVVAALVIANVKQDDYSRFNCTIQNSFGSVSHVTSLLAPSADVTVSPGSGALIAVFVLVTILVIIIIFIAAYFTKRRLVYRGNLYMDSNSETNRSSKSSQDLCTQQHEPVSALTPLTVSTDRPDVIKHFNQDVVDSLPVETEYPADDAGCAEYNMYLDTIRNSPAYLEKPSQIPSYNKGVSPVPTPVTITRGPSSRTSSPACRTSPLPENKSNKVIPLVPYTDTPDSRHSPTHASNNGSPLTYIQEETEESTTELL